MQPLMIFSVFLLQMMKCDLSHQFVDSKKFRCQEEITIQHILFEYQYLHTLYMQSNIIAKYFTNVNNLL